MNTRPLLVTVSGSFRKAMDEIQRAVYEFTDAKATVLSPADPRVVDAFGEFLYVASDRLRNIRLVQQRHLSSIEASDLLWLVAPGGYVGPSAAMELGFAAAVGVPTFSADLPTDLTLRSWVRLVSTPTAALRAVEASGRSDRSDLDVLVDPSGAVEAAQHHLEVVREGLLHPLDPRDPHEALGAAAAVHRLIRNVV